MRKVYLAMISGVALVGAAGSASAAATATAQFNVTATVQANCLVSATDLQFGNYTPGNGAITSSTDASVRCTKGTAYTVSLNAGTTTGGTLAQRLMANGANTLQYNLYTNNTHTTIFGDGTGGTGAPTGTGNGVAAGSAQTVTIYGSLPDNATNQDAVLGSYSDKITVTVTY